MLIPYAHHEGLTAPLSLHITWPFGIGLLSWDGLVALDTFLLLLVLEAIEDEPLLRLNCRRSCWLRLFFISASRLHPKSVLIHFSPGDLQSLNSAMSPLFVVVNLQHAAR